MESLWEQKIKLDATLLPKFMDDMMHTKLLSRSPVNKYQLWVFWSQEAAEHTSTSNRDIQHRITTALSAYYSFYLYHVLIQFWAPEMIGGRRHLTTTLQPFALTNLTNEKLIQYRKHCVGYKLLVADKEENDDDLIMEAGIVGRVFRNQLPEFGPEMSKYSVSEYPQRELALSCGINSTVAFPVLEVEPSGLGCVGVLELLFPTEFYLLQFQVETANKALKESRLRTIDTKGIHDQISDAYRGPIRKEMKAALKQVCERYKLTHAFTWLSCNDPRVSFQNDLLVASGVMSVYRNTRKQAAYFTSASLKVRQALVGKVFSSHIPHFCKDVCQLSIKMRHIVDLVTLFSSILETMKQQLKTFEVVTDLENEMFIEVHKLGESFVKPTISEGERTPTAFSLQSLHTTECTLNSTCRKAVWPSWNRNNHVNESDQAIPESSFSVNDNVQRADLDNGFKDLDESEQSSFGNSETASTNWVNLFGFRFSATQPHIPIPNQRRTEYLHSDGPLSEASGVFAHNIPPSTPVSNVEMMTVKVGYGKDIIKFDVPPSSSMVDLVENVITRWSFLKDKAFVIKYLGHESLDLNLLATDTDLQECMVRTRSRGEKVIRMVIEP